MIRLSVAFGLLMALLLVVGVVGLVSSSRQRAATDRVAGMSALIVDVGAARFSTADFNGWQTAYAFDISRGVAGAADDGGDSRKAFLAAAGVFRADVARVRAHPLTASESAALGAAESAFEDFMAVDRQVIGLYRQGTSEGRRQADALILGREIELFEKIASAMGVLTAEVARENAVVVAGAGRSARESQGLIWVVLVVGLLLALGLAALLTVSVTYPSRRLGAVLERVREKDLTARVDAGGRDELTRMGVALNDAVSSVQTVVTRLADSSATMAAASEELSAVSVQLDQGSGVASEHSESAVAAAREMTSTLEIMSMATEQMTASIAETTSYALKAAQVASGAVAEAEATSSAFGDLEMASAQIGEILAAITQIAEQTNLLALNATIEAARAGDAGKGFAVVATEVKDLAHETASATEDITTKITAIQATTSRVAEAIRRISATVSGMHETQTIIAGALTQQGATSEDLAQAAAVISAGVERISEAMTGMAAQNQQTRAGAHAARQSAGDLAVLATDVSQLAHQFRY